MKIKGLHIADLHLDSPFRQMQAHFPELRKHMQEAGQKSLAKLVDLAIIEQVDVVLIVGDSFNSIKPHVKSQLFFKEQLMRLIDKQIEVVLVYGNHDYFNNNLLVEMPYQVHILPEQVEQVVIQTQSGASVTFCGFSYTQNHITTRKIQDYPLKNKQTDFTVGLLHGYLEGSQSSEGIYAPFSLQELNDKHYDYWALGHIHKRMLLQDNPPIVYSGSIQGLNRHETGAKGGMLFTLEKHKMAQLNWLDTSPIIWEKLTIEVAQQTLEELIDSVQQTAKTMVKDNQILLLSITWEIVGEVDRRLMDLLNTEDMKRLLSKPSLFVVHEALNYRLNKHFVNLDASLLAQWDQLKDMALDTIYQEALDNVFKQAKIRTLLPDLRFNQDLEKEIVESALQRLQVALHQGEQDENN